MSSRKILTINPSTEEVLQSYALMSDEQALECVDNAHKCFGSWRLNAPSERAARLTKVAELIRSRSDALAELMTTEMGKMPKEAQQEVELCASICEYTAEHAPAALEDEQRPMQGGRAVISYQPLGVILGIQPWNFPLYQVVRYAVPNLAAGNTVLLKHAQNVWGMAVAIESLFRDAGLPPNAFTTLRVANAQVEQLIRHNDVRGITFTGSAGAGRTVARQAAENLKKTVLELGSNDAYIILKDADMAAAVKACIKGRFNNAGQTCVGAKRFVVDAAVYDDFRDAYLEQIKGMTYGNPATEDVDMGPMARRDLRDGLHQQVMDSINHGATCLAGGAVPDRKGFFYPPTLLEDVQPGMPAYDDELFGPVASLIKAKDEDDALRIANDSRFGLGGGIFSADEQRAVELAKRHFDTGMININGYKLAQPNLPFGGVKNSGHGREHGGFGVREFVNIKSVMITQK